MQPLTTTKQAVEFWARKSAEFDILLEGLDHVLPATKHGDEVPFTDDTKDDVVEALEQARLAADTVLGAYTRVLHQEQANPNSPANPYGQHGY